MGKPLIQEVTEATGLPQELVQEELTDLLQSRGFSPAEVTIDQLRIALADYMRQVLLEAKDDLQEGVWIDEEADV